jgi:hypothetical protein
MDWIDIASIVFVCTAANHLGLVSAIEDVTGCHGLPIIGCPKCLTFWCVLLYGCYNIVAYGTCGIVTVLAISFLCAYLAIWLELLMGIVDYYYNKVLYRHLRIINRGQDLCRTCPLYE